jgi:hypothetical protein
MHAACKTRAALASFSVPGPRYAGADRFSVSAVSCMALCLHILPLVRLNKLTSDLISCNSLWLFLCRLLVCLCYLAFHELTVHCPLNLAIPLHIPAQFARVMHSWCYNFKLEQSWLASRPLYEKLLVKVDCTADKYILVLTWKSATFEISILYQDIDSSISV